MQRQVTDIDHWTYISLFQYKHDLQYRSLNCHWTSFVNLEQHCDIGVSSESYQKRVTYLTVVVKSEARILRLGHIVW